MRKRFYLSCFCIIYSCVFNGNLVFAQQTASDKKAKSVITEPATTVQNKAKPINNSVTSPAQSAELKNSKTQTQTNDTFTPSEAISEDLAVSFPVDI